MIKSSPLSLVDDYGGDESLSLAMAMQRVTSKLAAAAWGCDVHELHDAADSVAPGRLPLERSRSSAFTPVGMLSKNAELLCCENVHENGEDRYNRSPKVSKTSSDGACDRASPASTSNRSTSPIRPLSLLNNSNPENARKHLLEDKTVSRSPTVVVAMTVQLGVLFQRITTANTTTSSNGTSNDVGKKCVMGGDIASTTASVSDVSLQSEAVQDPAQEHNCSNNVKDKTQAVTDGSWNSTNHNSSEEGNALQSLSDHAIPLHVGNYAPTAPPPTTTATKQHDKKYKRRTSQKSIDNNSNITTICEESVTTPTADEKQRRQRKCLTAPCKGESNSGLDNEDGNLIVYEADIIEVPNSSFCYLDKSKSHVLDLCSPMATTGVTQFQVTDLLGQGTFAQVFQCVNVATGEQVAIKVIKNKPAYTRQASVEIEIFRHLLKNSSSSNGKNKKNTSSNTSSSPWVNLECYFFYQQHLCLVFELLGCNLYEVLKKRQLVGLPLAAVKSIVRQSLVGIKRLAEAGVVHCDCKPENIVLVESKTSTRTNCEEQHDDAKLKCDKATIIKLIDFGSAAFEGRTTHSYIQSRFYRSPEVLIGLPYDSAIDIWSLGCVAAELFLGLPILPGMHEHDQLGRIAEMIGPLPDSMVEKCTKVNRYFVKSSPLPTNKATTPSRPFPPKNLPPSGGSSLSTATSSWRLKTREEYAATLPESERAADLQAQNANRYFKRTKLEDIVMLHGRGSLRKNSTELVSLKWFIHLLKGMLEPDPHKRWTARQSLEHPFFSDDITLTHQQQNPDLRNFTWKPSWDPSILRRQLQYVERTRCMKAPKSIRKPTVTRDKSPVKEKLQQSETVSPSSRRSLLPHTILEQHGDNSINFKTNNESTKIGSPPPSIALSTALDDVSSTEHSDRMNPYTMVPAVHASTFNPAMVSSPRYLSANATNEMHLSPYHFPVTANNALSMGPGAGGLHSSFVQPSGQGLGSNPPLHNLDGQDGFDYVTAQYGSLPLYIAVRATIEPQHVYDRAQYLPLQGELGYALTRPGVVPGHSNFDFLQQQQVPLQQSQPFHGFGTSPGAMANPSVFSSYAYSPQMNRMHTDSVSLMHSCTPANLLMRRSESGINISESTYNGATDTILPLRSQSFSYLVDDISHQEMQHGELESSISHVGRHAHQPRGATSLLAQQLAAHEQDATPMHMLFPQQSQQLSLYSFQSSQTANEALAAPLHYGHAANPHHTYGAMYQMNAAALSDNSAADSFGQRGSGRAVCLNNPMVSGHDTFVDAGSSGISYGVDMPAVMMGTVPVSTLNHPLPTSTGLYIHYAPSSSMPGLPAVASKKQQRPHQAGTQRR